MVKLVRDSEMAIGKIDYDLTRKPNKKSEISILLFVVKDIKEGILITEINGKTNQARIYIPFKTLFKRI